MYLNCQKSKWAVRVTWLQNCIKACYIVICSSTSDYGLIYKNKKKTGNDKSDRAHILTEYNMCRFAGLAAYACCI